jgi:sialate O-acetylesterase
MNIVTFNKNRKLKRKNFKMTIFIKLFSLLNALLFCVCEIPAQKFKFAAAYGDHMILQRAPHKAKLWGYADAGASVSLNLFGIKYSTVAKRVEWSSSYVWKIILMPVEADNKPITIEIIQTTLIGVVTKIQLFDVLFGDIWMCAGQGNMCMPLQKSINGTNEAKKWSYYENLRLLQIPHTSSKQPINDLLVQIPWWVPSENILNRFSAACWYFGRELYEQLKIPIGLVQNCVE